MGEEKKKDVELTEEDLEGVAGGAAVTHVAPAKIGAAPPDPCFPPDPCLQLVPPDPCKTGRG
jgi:hypothetical protein